MTKKQSNILAFIIPIIIFLIGLIINKFYPFGNYSILFSDSNVQYPAFYMGLKEFTSFSLKVGFGFNFYGTLLYYLMSPLNILIYLFNTENYIYFFILITLIKLGLCSLTMNILLNYKNDNKYNFILSIIYALNGYTLSYFINSMWLDSIYMLPLVMLGILKIIKENKYMLYYIALTLSIIFNYYIGYMICIFSLIFFIYSLINSDSKDKKTKIKNFIIISLLSGLTTAVILIPACKSLLIGKVKDFTDNEFSYFKFNKNIIYLFANLCPFSLIFYGKELEVGGAQIYLTIGLLILFISSLITNKNKKYKISTLIILLIYILSFSFNLFDYAWQMFQPPYWFNHRYSFTLIAFIIYICSDSFKKVETKDLTKIIYIIMGITTLILMSLMIKYFKYEAKDIKYFILATVTIIIFTALYVILLLKEKKTLYIILMLIELIIGTIYSLNKHKINEISLNIYGYQSATINKKLYDTIEKYKSDDLYRMELIKYIGYNDGLFYGYNGITYFNSIRNEKILKTFDEKLNQTDNSNNSIVLEYFDKYLLSIFNVKYLLSIDYVYENDHPLSLGFMIDKNAKDIKLESNYNKNITNIINKFTNTTDPIYENIENQEILKKEEIEYANSKITTIKVKLNKDLILITNKKTKLSFCIDTGKNNYFSITNGCMKINEEKISKLEVPIELNKNDILEISLNDYNSNKITLIDKEIYDRNMGILEDKLLDLKYNNGIYEGNINVNKEGILFISIPNEPGINVYVDGNKTKIESILGAYIGINLKEGQHNIKIKYDVPGLKIGLIISIISFIFSIMELYKLKKNY